jgi:hypothetical protein
MSSPFRLYTRLCFPSLPGVVSHHSRSLTPPQLFAFCTCSEYHLAVSQPSVFPILPSLLFRLSTPRSSYARRVHPRRSRRLPRPRVASLSRRPSFAPLGVFPRHNPQQFRFTSVRLCTTQSFVHPPWSSQQSRYLLFRFHSIPLSSHLDVFTPRRRLHSNLRNLSFPSLPVFHFVGSSPLGVFCTS